MKSTLVRTSTSDSVELHGQLYEPATKTSNAVLFIHGIHGNFYTDHFIDDLAKTFTENGFVFLSVNTRGHDHFGSASEIFHDSIQDIKAWIDFLENKKIDSVTILGHSLGGSKFIYYLAKTQDIRIKKVALLSPTPLTILEKDPAFTELVSLAREMTHAGKGAEIMPKKILGNLLMSADTFLHYLENSDALHIFDYESSHETLLSHIKVPIYAIWGTKDKYGALFSIEETLKFIKDKAVSSSFVKTEVIENAGHSYVGFEDELSSHIMNFLKE